MKLTTILSASVVTLSLLAISTPAAHAATITNSDGTKPEYQTIGKTTTTTNVSIIDNADPTNPDDKDPLNPADPDQKMLTLDSVPREYNFETKLQQGNAYSIESAKSITEGLSREKDIEVFNDRTDRNWSVKAVVENNELTRTGDAKIFKIGGFTITTDTEHDLFGTGDAAIVAKSAVDKTTANNTGTIKTPVTAASISFSDPDKALKADDKLSGQIDYTLYNTIDAQ